MKKHEMLIGLGLNPEGEDEEMEGEEDSVSDEAKVAAIETFLDVDQPMDVRVEAFSRAVNLCKGY